MVIYSKVNINKKGLKVNRCKKKCPSKKGWYKKRPLKEGSKSGGPGSNRQPLAWKAKALPLSYRREHDQLYKNMPDFKGVP